MVQCVIYHLCNILFISGSSGIRLQPSWPAGDPLKYLRHLVRLSFLGALARDLASPISASLAPKDN